MTKITQELCYVGYLDILGYKDFFAKHEDKADGFLELIDNAFRELISNVSSFGMNSLLPAYKNFKPTIKIFSDNIILSIKCRDDDLTKYAEYSILLNLIAKIQSNFIAKYGLILRGAVVRDMFFINDSFAFGKGLIRSYETEQKAVYPRVVLEQSEIYEIDKFIQEHEKGFPFFLGSLFYSAIARDSDQEFFINYLNMQGSNFFNEALYCFYKRTNGKNQLFDYPTTKDIELIYKIETTVLASHQKFILEKLKEFGNFEDLIVSGRPDLRMIDERTKILKKFLWVLSFHNKSCELEEYSQFIIKYTITIDPMVHQPIVEVLMN